MTELYDHRTYDAPDPAPAGRTLSDGRVVRRVSTPCPTAGCSGRLVAIIEAGGIPGFPPYRPCEACWFEAERVRMLRSGAKPAPTSDGAWTAELERFKGDYPLVFAKLAHLLSTGPGATDGRLFEPGSIIHDRVGDPRAFADRSAAGDWGVFGRPGDLSEEERAVPEAFGRTALNRLAIERGDGLVLARYAGRPFAPWVDVMTRLVPGRDPQTLVRATADEGRHELA